MRPYGMSAHDSVFCVANCCRLGQLIARYLAVTIEAVSAAGELIVMFIKQSLSLFLSGCLLLCTTPGAFADPADQSEPLPPVQEAQQSPAQLQQLVAPIALYADALVAQVLAA